MDLLKFNLRETAIIEGFTKDSISFSNKRRISQISLLKNKPQEKVYSIESDKPGFVVFSEMFFPGWKAEINNEKSEIYRVDFILRGLFVPKGKNKVKFYFEPTSLKYGSYIQITSIIVLIGLIFQSLKKIFLIK